MTSQRIRDVHPKTVSFLQDQLSQYIVGDFVQCEMSPYKRIYGLEILDGRMGLLIFSELPGVGQRRTCQNSSVIYRYLSFVNGDLKVLLLLILIYSE